MSSIAQTLGLLNPSALVFFAVVPALILGYLARERAARVTVSSVMAFRALRGMRRERFAGWPRLNWTFFVELLILSLAVLAMAQPYVIHRSNPIALVFDNSAVMQAKTPEGATRFDKAREEASAMLSNSNASTVAIYLTTPQPHLASPRPMPPAEAREVLAAVKPLDAPADPAAVASLLTELSSGSKYSKVIFASARPLAPPTPPRISAITVGDPIDNFAIGSFTLRRETFGAAALHAQVTLANFSTIPQHLQVEVTGDDRHLGTAKASLGAGETGMVEFPSLPPAAVYKAKLTPADGFALDNTAYATSGSVKNVSLLFVSPNPADANGLNQIPGVSVATKSPDAFTPGDLANVDLAIFEFSAPKDLPTVNSLLVMPPPDDPVFHFATSAFESVAVTGWSTTDALTDSVNFRLLNIRQGELFAVHPWMASIVDGPGGGLLLRGERQGHRFVATGFNPFPYLGRRNLPMSILTLNILGYLAGVGANSGGFHTGQPWLVPAGVEKILVPSGKSISVRPGTLFTDVAAQGIYSLIETGGGKTARAINLADFTVSDFEHVPPLKIESTGSAMRSEAAIEKAPLTRYILAAILALLVLEAILVYRRKRPALEA